MASMQNQLSATNTRVVKLEEQTKSYEEKIALLEKELDDVRIKFSEEIQANDEEALTKEAGAYVKAHSDLLTELVKHYPDENVTPYSPVRCNMIP